MGGKAMKILDPANIFGKRPGGFSLRDAMDPGGAILKTTTGSDIGYKIADPGKLYQPKETITQPSASDLYNQTQAAKAAAASKKKLINYSKLKGKPGSNIMVSTTELEDFK